MGAENLRTIQYTGSGSNAGIGQNRNPNAAWPLVRVTAYTREIDLNTPSSRVQMVRIQNGAEQTQNQIILPTSSWNTQSNIWISPFVFLKAAMASNDATVKAETLDGDKFNVVTFVLQNKYKIAGYINANNLVERVQTWIDNDVLGDMLVEGQLNEQRSLALIAEVTKLIANKPIRYLVNTQHLFDHSGGLRTYVDQGVTIITHAINKPFYDKSFTSPRTLNPDPLSQSKK